jgi:transcriptional regulator with XRE-family HTH domain
MGKRFQAVRLARGLTQAELARRAKVHLRSLQEWEQGTRVPRWDRVIQLADGLGCSLDELAGRPTPRKRGVEK